jgi:hypothetical protein
MTKIKNGGDLSWSRGLYNVTSAFGAKKAISKIEDLDDMSAKDIIMLNPKDITSSITGTDTYIKSDKPGIDKNKKFTYIKKMALDELLRFKKLDLTGTELDEAREHWIELYKDKWPIYEKSSSLVAGDFDEGWASKGGRRKRKTHKRKNKHTRRRKTRRN